MKATTFYSVLLLFYSVAEDRYPTYEDILIYYICVYVFEKNIFNLNIA